MPTSGNSHPDNTELESGESFDAIFSEYEQSHARQAEGGGRQIEGTVVAVSADSVYLDIGYKTEGVLPLAPFQSANEAVKPGDKFLVAVKGRNPEGYYELSRFKVEQPRDWSALERAFADKAPIAGTVTGVVKGGLSVDVGVRAFMPASRSGARDAAELEKLVGQQIRCRIIKLEVSDEDVVVDRRVLTEEEDRSTKERRYGELKEGETVHGEVRSLTGYGAFVNIGGVDALLHVGDIAWGRVNKPEDVLSVGQQIEARVLKVDPEKQRISVGMKQLLPHPWDADRGQAEGRRSRARRGDAGCRFWSFRRNRARGRGLDPLVGDVLGQEGEEAERCAQAGRHRGSGGSGSEHGRTPPLPGPETDVGRSLGGGRAEVSGGLGDRRTGYQLHQIRRLRAACGRG